MSKNLLVKVLNINRKKASKYGQKSLFLHFILRGPFFT
jgi:hypothetical protein